MEQRSEKPGGGEFAFKALNLYDFLVIKDLRDIVEGTVVEGSRKELEVSIGPKSYMFVFRFGCVVFFNATDEVIGQQLRRIESVAGKALPDVVVENYVVRVADANKVEFDFAELKHLDLAHLRLIARTIGQSAALSYFERIAENLVKGTNGFMQGLSRSARLPWSTKSLLRMIGSTASARQHIISNVAVLDTPTDVVQTRELEHFFFDIQENFEIGMRFKTLEKKLALTQENIEILTDLASSRRNTILEALIVLLIVVEMVMGLTH